MLEIKEKKIMLGDKEAIIRMGEYAHQANGSVTLQCGETVVQAVCAMGKDDPNLDFFPLQVEYKENLYAGGKIKANRFMKRPGRPSDESILKGRFIDRTIRPMFPKDFKREVQVVVNVFASDGKNPHDVLSLTAVCAALAISDIPFDANLGGIRMSRVDGAMIVNPTYEECAKQDYELVLGGNGERIVMIETAANIISDDDILAAFKASFEPLGKVAASILELEKEHGKEKVSYEPTSVNQEILERIKLVADERIELFFKGLATKEIYRKEFGTFVGEKVLELFSEEELEEKYSKGEIMDTLDYIFKKTIRKNILERKLRLDGRGVEEIREITAKVGVLPVVHGSGMFMRGETQVLNILTLAAPGSEQLLEEIEGESRKKYIHAYSALPFSVGETGRMSGPGRREIGHGALAEKALVPVIPNEKDFPYVIRLVSEVMGQNGSSSMASTCASTLSLMDAGVPIKAPVAGISVGLMSNEDDINEFITITDIQGSEDFGGDMDFKVAGTYDGITAIQMDTKIKGLTYPIIESSIRQASTARNQLLDIITGVIPEPRKDVAASAPRIESIQLPEDKIAAVIGSGGKVIKGLAEAYSVEINIDDNGVCSIATNNRENLDACKEAVKLIIEPAEPGKNL